MSRSSLRRWKAIHAERKDPELVSGLCRDIIRGSGLPGLKYRGKLHVMGKIKL